MSPATISTLPAIPATLLPTLKEISPLASSLLGPVVKLIEPAPPAADPPVKIRTSPLVPDAEAISVAISTSPLDADADEPLETYTLPPSPLADEPP
jgi:hypothetical protein